MPTAVIDDEGTELYYEDSGVPPNSTDYTTVICVHGYILHAPSFRPMFSHAAARNLRLIAFNTREYPGSSPLTDTQLSLFQSTDEDEQDEVITDFSRDLARFISYIVDHESVPPPEKNESGKKSGGICVYGYTAGGMMVFGMLAHLHSFEEEVQQNVEKFVTSIICHDVPAAFLGIPDPSKTYSPARDFKTPPDQLTEMFLVWVSSWFKPYPDLDSVTTSTVAEERPFTTDSSDPRHKSTYETISPAQKKEIAYPEIGCRLGPGLVSCDIYANNLRNAVFDTKGVLEGVPVYYLWGASSIWIAPWGARRLKDMLDEPAEEGEQRRQVYIERLGDMNHFGHIDQPERMIGIIADHVS